MALVQLNMRFQWSHNQQTVIKAENTEEWSDWSGSSIALWHAWWLVMMPCQPGSWVVIGHTFPRLELVGDFARRTWMMFSTNWSFGGWNHQPAWYSGIAAIAFTSFGTSSAPPQFPYHISPAVRKTCTERSFPCLSGKWLEHVREWDSVGEVFLVFLFCRSPADHWLSLRVNFTGDNGSG